jgi:radical SAM protein with 4Fe4S-binding SPASM domain
MLGSLISQFGQALKAMVTRRLRIQSDRIPYDFDHLPLKKILNACLVEVSILLKPERLWAWPVHLMIELTNYCNLACALCPVTVGLGRPQGHMDFKTFKSVMDEIGDYIFIILLWDWGEPFLNPSIYQVIACAKQKGCKVVSSTNGHLFGKKDHADRVIDSGLNTLIFAIDGIIQEMYQVYRQGGQLESALKGIRMVVARKRALCSRAPLVNLRFIVMKYNEHEVPQLKAFARSLGVDALTLKTLNPYCQDPYWETDSKRPNEFLPDNPRYRRFKYMSTGLDRIRLRRNPCKQLWNSPTIHWNGVIRPCTYDPKDKVVLGDLKQDTLEDIWFGAPYRHMRREFRTQWEKINLCGECSYAYKGGNCSRETMAEAFFFDQNHQD